MTILKINVGTPTFRHGNGSNNFVNNDIPLGWEYGSDGEEVNLGVIYLYNLKRFFELSVGSIRSGQESITSRAYDPYHWTSYQKNKKFPSGEIFIRKFLKIKFNHIINDKFWFLCESEFIQSEAKRGKLKTTLNINYSFDY